jgi:hypothetical protein
MRLLSIVLLGIFFAGCSNYQYKSYQTSVDPLKVTPLDLSSGHGTPAVVYFGSTSSSVLGLSYHGLLLATHVDDVQLENAGRTSLFGADGYQALKLRPGKHKIEYCWLNHGAILGEVQCNLNIFASFEDGKKYMVHWHTEHSVNKRYLRTYLREMTE